MNFHPTPRRLFKRIAALLTLLAALQLAGLTSVHATETITLKDGTKIIAEKVDKHDGFLRVFQKAISTQAFHGPRPTTQRAKDEYRATDYYWDRLDDETLHRFFPGKWEQLQAQKYKELKRDNATTAKAKDLALATPDNTSDISIAAKAANLRLQAKDLLTQTTLKKDVTFTDRGADGQGGTMTVAAGNTVGVKSIAADSAVISVGDHSQSIPLAHTDLAEKQKRAAQLNAEAEQLRQNLATNQTQRQRDKEFQQAEQAVYQRALETRALVDGVLVERKKAGGTPLTGSITAKDIVIMRMVKGELAKVRGTTMRLYDGKTLGKEEVFLLDFIPEDKVGADIKVFATEIPRNGADKRAYRVTWPFTFEQWQQAKIQQ